MILVYDTETTGLPLWQEPSDHPDQPHITQIAAQLCDEDDGTILASMNTMIRPDGWTIPEDVARLTGITTEKAAACGVSITIALDLFFSLWERAALRVAHNESFDARMVRIEIKHNPRHVDAIGDYAERWKDGAAFCTANASKPILQLPPTAKMLASRFKNQFKTPNMAEAHRFFMGKDFANAHSAAADVAACKAVYFAILKHNAARADSPVEA
jgi:DNA polymerase-3 subunit epsilon